MRESTTRRIVLTVLLTSSVLLVAVGAGCPPQQPENGGDGENQSPSVAHPAVCASDAECADDAICVDGLCSLEVDVDTVDFDTVISPPNNSPAPTQRLDASAQPLMGAELVAATAARRQGEVDVESEGDPPPGTLLFDAQSSAPVSTTRQPVRNGEFDYRLLDRDYEVTFVVDDPEWPRIPLGTERIEHSDAPLQFQVPGFDELRVVTGTLQRDVVDLGDLLSEPVEGAEIVAVGDNPRVQSNVAVTGEDGEFTLRLPPGEESFDVRVFASSPDQLIPRVTFDGVIDADTDDLSLSVGEIDLDLELADLSVDLTAESVDGHSPDWSRYGVEIRGGLGVGELVRRPDIDDEGGIETELPPGLYDIEITAPPGVPWSSLEETVDLVVTGVSRQFELSSRTRVAGTVTDVTGDGLDGARIGVHADGLPTPTSLITDGDGAFEAWLEPGDYRFHARPPVDRALPATTVDLEVTQSDGDIDIEIPRGVVVSGGLLSDDGSALAHTVVRAMAHNGDDGPSTYGEAMTDAGGFFRLVLPPELIR